MAAQRAGVKKVYIPFENTDDLIDVAEEVKEKLEIIPVKTVKDVLEHVWKIAKRIGDIRLTNINSDYKKQKKYDIIMKTIPY